MQEKLSAMMDGEWDEHEFAALIAAIDEDDECASNWREFHLISDVMRQQQPMSADFMSRFCERFEDEPVVLAPGAMRRRSGRVNPRWVALSMAASVVLVSATAFYVSRGQGVSAVPMVAQVAANQPQVGVQQVGVPSDADVDVNPYLLAHQAMVGNPGFSHRPVILTGAEAERASVATVH